MSVFRIKYDLVSISEPELNLNGLRLQENRWNPFAAPCVPAQSHMNLYRPSGTLNPKLLPKAPNPKTLNP